MLVNYFIAIIELKPKWSNMITKQNRRKWLVRLGYWSWSRLYILYRVCY